MRKTIRIDEAKVPSIIKKLMSDLVKENAEILEYEIDESSITEETVTVNFNMGNIEMREAKNLLESVVGTKYKKLFNKMFIENAYREKGSTWVSVTYYV